MPARIKPVHHYAKYAFTVLLVCIVLFPIYWMLVSSFMPNSYLMSLPPHFLPKNPNFANYIKIFTNNQYLTFFKNSFLVSSSTVVLCLIVSILSGYGFSRYNFKGKGFAMTAILTVQMFPIVAILISLYTLYLKHARHIPQHHRAVNQVDSGVSHGGIGNKEGSFFNSPESAARYTVSQDDHGFGSRKYVARVHLLGCTFKTIHGCNSYQIGSKFLCLFLNIS